MDLLYITDPDALLTSQVYSLANEYTRDHFTKNFPAEIASDICFQRTACLMEGHTLVSVLVYTCLDGIPQITFLATQRSRKGQGYGSRLVRSFLRHLSDLGFHRCELYTHIPYRHPENLPTVAFYEHMGFRREKEDLTLWEDGALKMSICF